MAIVEGLETPQERAERPFTGHEHLEHQWGPEPRSVPADKLRELVKEIAFGCIEVETSGRRYKLLGDDRRAIALLASGQTMRQIGRRIEEFLHDA